MKSQKGFTLLELLIGVAISGLIVSFLGTAMYQIITVTDYGGDKMIAMHELQNVAYWANLDGQRASSVNGGDELLLTLPDDSSITYVVEGTELHRTAGGSQMTLARNISGVSFSIEGRLITMTVTSSPEGRWDVSDNATYKICLRPTQEG